MRYVYLPKGMSISIMSGFDLPWKGELPQEFSPSEEYIGLFTGWRKTADGRTLPPIKKTVRITMVVDGKTVDVETSAVDVVASDKWPVQSRE